MVLLNKTSAVVAVAAVAALVSNGVHSFAPSAHRSISKNARLGTSTFHGISPFIESESRNTLRSTQSQLFAKTKTKTKQVATTNGSPSSAMDTSILDVEASVDEAKKVELIVLGIWGISISAFILINNFYGPWPLILKTVPERAYFLSHMIGGMLFAGGIILTTCIERLVAKSQNPEVLQFWFTKVPELDGLIVVPALTISMVSGTGLSIVRYGGLNIAPPHVGAIFWTLIAFMSWWAATDLTTQGPSLKAVERMYEQYELGEVGLETPKVVTDRHFSNVVSCFFILLLYSMMVLKPGTFFPFPWDHWT
eukprot:CAMPEP_0198284920 /NCGR_PEP_ID=MMETSP1449-20131203/4283_1 /TAXON_ID=420275 /ORGANISM="Attheya septentrionalis, Strain CCMP2084" /LENGTH=308 /DNA_ID=CAMNT_0043982141 /DNA_START=186 /DNA_END=1112 /DNA_ORIENTATION=-